jgi:hypothetical protein
MMDKRLQKIADETKMKFGLEAYQLETYSIYKERDSKGEAYYTFNMEWYPEKIDEPVEEDTNPDGTAIIEYNIQKQMYKSVSFVQGKSFSTRTHFTEMTPEEIADWVEKETGLTYGTEFNLSQANGFGFQFKSDVDGIGITPSGIIEVEFDSEGKLTSFYIFGTIPSKDEVEIGQFTLTLEEIEPLVKKQLGLVKFPLEADKRFVPVYAMEEIYVTMDGLRTIPFFEHERLEVLVDEVVEWDHPFDGELIREDYLTFLSEANVDEAFGNVGVEEKLTLSEEEIERSKNVARDVLRTEFPDESGKWKLSSVQRQENSIEVVCQMNEENPTIFNRKVVVFINPQTMSLLNYIDNGAMFEIFDSFAPAEKATVKHSEAFEKMIPYITLDPAYVYDAVIGKYALCGLLDAVEGVNAVTGEVVSLEDL